MAAAIIPFDFETNAVRAVMMGDAPWFVAADVCRVLDHSNSRMALKRLDADEKGVTKAYTLGGRQEVGIISESGLYALIFLSRKPAAKRFRKWVTAEVLPTLRRDGAYTMPGRGLGDLVAKRAFLAAAPEAHRNRAEDRAAILKQIASLIDGGASVGAATGEVAAEAGVTTRTLQRWRRAIHMVPEADWPAAVTPRWSVPKGPHGGCHPEVMRVFLQQLERGARLGEAWRFVAGLAAERGWSPVPSKKALAGIARRTVGIRTDGLAPGRTRVPDIKDGVA